jgi:predicted DNA-binding transcriptional regulator AlpA
MPKTKALCTPVPAQPAYSIAQFCCQHGISRSLFYKLLQEGHAPRIMKAGKRTLISHEAAEKWRHSMETATHTREAA